MWLGEAVAGILPVQFDKQAVAVHLGQHARRGYRQARRVALNHGLLRARPVDGVEAVDEQVVRRERELLDGQPHGQQRGLGEC